jgi:hypothetical protein
MIARPGMCRANAPQAKNSQGADADAARVRALAAYKDFLTLWKDADSDIPILKEAKAEYEGCSRLAHSMRCKGSERWPNARVFVDSTRFSP